MKIAVSMFALALIAAWAQVKPMAAVAAPASVMPAEKGRVSWQTLSVLEKRIDDRITAVGGGDPAVLLGNTRGVYIEGYGAVLTTQIDLINTPRVTPFNLHVDASQVHQRKTARLPVLRQALREMWQSAAAELKFVPDNQQVVLAVRILYYQWEDTHGLPGQIILRAERKSGDVQIEEQ